MRVEYFLREAYAAATRRRELKTYFRPGDRVIYRKQKHSVRPSPQARSVYAAPLGDYYCYEVDKYWTVVAIEAGQKLVVRTRRGKQVTVNAGDPALRRAQWWERLLFRRRFPAITSIASPAMPEADGNTMGSR